MRASLEAAGVDVPALLAGAAPEAAGILESVKAWRDLWSGGNGAKRIAARISRIVA